jgi:DNA polymerase-3 subunit delta
MTYENIILDVRKKIFSPIYFFWGEESYYIDLLSDYIENNILSEDEKGFNLQIVYGKDINVSSLMSLAKSFPMMANYQVIIVREAQMIDKIEEMLPYIKAPLKSTILVLSYKYKKPDGRTAFLKELNKTAVVFESKAIKEDQLPDWIIKYVDRSGYKISHQVANILAEYLGSDLEKIANEIVKLFINIEKGSEITADIIEKNIGFSKEFTIFELEKAIVKKDVYRANLIIKHFSENPKEYPFIKTISVLNSYFQKVLIFYYAKNIEKKAIKDIPAIIGINPYFAQDYEKAANAFSYSKLRNIISFLREYNLKALKYKNESFNDTDLLKELIFKILH